VRWTKRVNICFENLASMKSPLMGPFRRSSPEFAQRVLLGRPWAYVLRRVAFFKGHELNATQAHRIPTPQDFASEEHCIGNANFVL
jgi:hypothetical protein